TTVTSPDIMGSPARRLTNPITRCWAHPNYGYAGTDDRQGTDQRLDTKRLTLMSGRILSTNHLCLSRYPARRGVPGQPMMVLLAIPCCSGEPPPRRRAENVGEGTKKGTNPGPPDRTGRTR